MESLPRPVHHHLAILCERNAYNLLMKWRAWGNKPSQQKGRQLFVGAGNQYEVQSEVQGVMDSPGGRSVFAADTRLFAVAVPAVWQIVTWHSLRSVPLLMNCVCGGSLLERTAEWGMSPSMTEWQLQNNSPFVPRATLAHLWLWGSP